MKVYPEDRLWDEMAFIAYYFHWEQDEIMCLSHADRQRWCAKISDINRRTSDAPRGHNPFEVQ